MGQGGGVGRRSPRYAVHRVTDEEALALLGLPASADSADVRTARRRLARSLHPDVTADDGTRMRQVPTTVCQPRRRPPSSSPTYEKSGERSVGNDPWKPRVITHRTTVAG